MNKIALFTTVNQNYVDYAIRCLEIFNEKNPDKFDLFIICNDPISVKQVQMLSDHNIQMLSDRKSKEAFKTDWTTWPSECYWYFNTPNILSDGYEYSMYVDCDNVCLSELDFSWLDDSFVMAGSPRMRNNLSEEIDAWYYLRAVATPEKRKYLESSFDLINKDNIIDINSGVLIFNNKRWKKEGLYEKAVNLFNETKEAGYPMTDDDSLLGLLMLCTPKSFYKHIDTSWNWYYEMPKDFSTGGEDAKILHMAWLKPWVKNTSHNKNVNLEKGKKIWNMNRTTIHIVGTPGNASRKNPTIDPFSRSSYYLTDFLHKEGWRVNYYGYKESNPGCSEKFNVCDIDWKKTHVEHSENSPPTVTDNLLNDFSQRVFDKLKDNVLEGDIIICMWSDVIGVLPLRDLTPYVIDGHIGHYAPSYNTSYHVYACHSLQSWLYAKNEERYANRWNDVVIPPISHSKNDFKYVKEKDDYILFMSRLIENKGLGIVLDVAKELPNQKFKIAGTGDWGAWVDNAGDNVEFIGYIEGDERKKVLSKAKAVMTPSLYFEPFGLTAVEAALSGTPIITTDWGGYGNNVVDGVTGFRCVTIYDFVNAINRIDEIDKEDCVMWGDLHTAEELIDRWKEYLIKVKRGNFYSLQSKEEIEESFRF